MDVAADWVCVEADRGEAGRGVRGLFPRQGTLGRPGQKRIIYPRAAHRWDLGRPERGRAGGHGFASQLAGRQAAWEFYSYSAFGACFSNLVNHLSIYMLLPILCFLIFF